MKVYSVIVFNCTNADTPTTISVGQDLSQFSFWKRGTVKEFLFFSSREVVKRTTPGTRQSIVNPNKNPDAEVSFSSHVFVNTSKVGCVVITDEEYQARVAHSLAAKSIDEVVKAHGSNFAGKDDQQLPTPELDTLLVKYQQPQEVDAVLRIQKDVDETKEIVKKSIDQLLQRGEKLEDLMQRSQDLSFQSKQFAKQSKDLNRCCVLV